METQITAVARLKVELYIDSENLNHAERLLDDWLRNAEDDERLRAYIVSKSDWVPEIEIPYPF